ncbi:protein phosphatase 1B-like isoform X1 [Penaeus japonicus]|uniref:protein phosphatase 1B-like isoform X1 n=1 Tax=Penaeus japonicus TaxID=27405 RepID=UPI001C711B7C|nr:protein phosphatase 1B-like isoform X1 [Penaeus japonicus]
MGAFLDKPKTEKHNEHGGGNGLRYGLSSMQGWRIEMEDAHAAVANLPGDLKDWAFFAVFDGHAGARVSAHCSEHLLNSITSGEEFQPQSIAKLAEENEETTINTIKKGIHAGFLRLDESMRQMPEVASGEDKSGTTAVCALISPTHIFVANCGDSRAVLYRGGKIGFSTQDHKPVNPVEKERIQNAGGSVMIQRVNGSLAVSRALGDYEYKNVEGKGPCEQLVSPEPEIYVERRQSDDEFLVLACDGVWDVMTNEDLCAFVRSRLLLSDDLESIANHVVDTCLYKGSRDNMSIVLLTLPGAPKVSEEAIKKEKEMEDIIEKKVAEVCAQEGPVSMPQIMSVLAEEYIPGLPPGGGHPAKRGFVEQIFRKLRPDCANAENDAYSIERYT